MLLIALVLALWRLSATAEVLRPYPAIPSPAGTLAPEHALLAAHTSNIMDLAWRPDGKTLYVYLQVDALDLWSLAISAWPELTLIAVLLAGAAVAWRLWRRPQGGALCRRCGYLAGNSGGDRCPECGLELTPRNRVRTWRPRWQPAAAATLMLAIIAAYAGVSRLPRQGAMSAWLHWPSAALCDWCQRRGGSLQRLADAHKVQIYCLVEVDPSSGRLLHTFLRKADTLRPWNSMALSEDGTLLCAVEGRQLWAWDTASGRVLDRLAAPSPRGGAHNFFTRPACSADGRHVYVADWAGSIFQWTPRSGNLPGRISIDELFPEGAASMGVAVRSIDYAPGADRVVLLVERETDKWRTNVVTASADLAHPRALAVPSLGIDSSPNHVDVVAVSGDASCWFGLEMRGDLLVHESLDDQSASVTGPDAVFQRIMLPGSVSFGLGLSPDGRLLAVSRLSTTMAGATGGVSGLYATRPLARLVEIGGPDIAFRAFGFTAAGTKLAAAGVRVRSPSDQSWLIAIYDLGQLPQPPLRDAPGGE